MKTLKSKIVVSIAVGVMYVVFEYFEVYQYMPGMHCEGMFGCLGQAIFALYLLLLLPILLTVIGFVMNHEQRFRQAIVTLGVSFVVMIVSFLVLTELVKLREFRDVRDGEIASKEIDELIKQRDTIHPEVDRPLTLPNVDMARNATGRGVYAARVTPNELTSGEPAHVIISAQVGSAQRVKTVLLYRDTDRSIPPVAMVDDGTNGDVLANDTVYSVEEIINENLEKEIHFKIEIVYDDEYKDRSTQSLVLRPYWKRAH